MPVLSLQATGAAPQVEWGSHFCLFYERTSELLGALVPYFVAGLAHNEKCLWILPAPLPPAMVLNALATVTSNPSRYVASGQLELIPETAWYLKDGVFEREKALARWLEKVSHALEHGYDGLRVTGDSSWASSCYWEDWQMYEAIIHRKAKGQRFLALCTYSPRRAAEVVTAARLHDRAILRINGSWEML